MSKQSREPNKLLVAAIDFGTTFSGWSFLFRHEYESDPTKVFAKNWNNGTNISSKTPTTILIAPDGKTMEKFGYEAEDRYAVLASENKHHQYYYFRRFKMTLHNQRTLTRDVYLDDENGKRLPALRIFSLSIKFIHDDLLKECRRQTVSGSIDTDDIKWVITVPAIWNDAAKQFMREAAETVGIPPNQLSIALEPETASLFCKYLSVEKNRRSDGMTLDTFSPGSTYIVLDAGGGTVDITVHEVLPNDALKEVHSASGGAWGGTTVDDAFFQFLIKIFGAPIMKKFKTENMDDYLDVVRDFEVKKRSVSFEDVSTHFRLPALLMDLFEKETGESLKEVIQQKNFPGAVSLLPGNKLRLDANCMRSFFAPAVKNITEHIRRLVQHPAARKSTFLLMVGGFSESLYLQENIKMNFPEMKTIVPFEAGLVILKGAAIYGHSELVISERICKYTYGFCGYKRFNEGIDPEDHADYTKAERKRLKGAFYKLVEIGEPLGINERREWKGNRIAQNEKDTASFPLYGSSQKNPVGKWSADTFQVGILRARVTNMSVPRKERKFRISGIFGKTEIELQALEMSTGQLTSTSFDALF